MTSSSWIEENFEELTVSPKCGVPIYVFKTNDLPKYANLVNANHNNF